MTKIDSKPDTIRHDDIVISAFKGIITICLRFAFYTNVYNFNNIRSHISKKKSMDVLNKQMDIVT
jgi:hypothetical protein